MELWQVMVAVAGGIVALGGAAKVIANVVRWGRKVARIIDEMAGKPGEFGREPEPGIIERVDDIRKTQDTHTELIEKIHHEVFPNSSKSLRDVVDRIEKRLDEAQPQLQVNVNPPS